MKIECFNDQLNARLKTAVSVARYQHNQESRLEIQAEAGRPPRLVAASADLIAYSGELPALVHEPGVMPLTHGGLLREYLASLGREQQIALQHDPAAEHPCNRLERPREFCRLPVRAPQPAPPEIAWDRQPPDGRAETSGAALAAAFQKVAYAQARDDQRPSLQGLNLAVRPDGQIHCAAVDGFRLAAAAAPNAAEPPAEPWNLTIPSGIVALLQSSLTAAGADDAILEYFSLAQGMTLTLPTERFAFRALPGTFPNYSQMRPETPPRQYILATAEALRAAKAAKAVQSPEDDQPPLLILISGPSPEPARIPGPVLHCQAYYKEANSYQSYIAPAASQGEPLAEPVALNAQFLIDFLSNLAADQFALSLMGAREAAYLQDNASPTPGYALIMPTALPAAPDQAPAPAPPAEEAAAAAAPPPQPAEKPAAAAVPAGPAAAAIGPYPEPSEAEYENEAAVEAAANLSGPEPKPEGPPAEEKPPETPDRDTQEEALADPDRDPAKEPPDKLEYHIRKQDAGCHRIMVGEAVIGVLSKEDPQAEIPGPWIVHFYGDADRPADRPSFNRCGLDYPGARRAVKEILQGPEGRALAERQIRFQQEMSRTAREYAATPEPADCPA